MSAPTAPTATTIVTEALTRKMNGGTPGSHRYYPGSSYGLEKVKRDIMRVASNGSPSEKSTTRLWRKERADTPYPMTVKQF